MFASLTFSARVQAQDLGNDGLVRDQTFAYGEGLRRWDNIKRYGAERVVDRDRTLYQPDGVRGANYTFYPTIGTTALFDDNIFVTKGQRTSDTRFEIVPVVRARSDFARHVLDFSVGARHIEYQRHSNLSATDGHFRMDGALHFDHAHTLSLSVLSALDHEDRAAPEAPKNAGERTPVLHNRAVAGIKRDAGRLWASFSTSVERWDFQDVAARDGTVIDQQSRNTQVTAIQSILGYRFSPGFEVQGKVRALRQAQLHPGPTDSSAFGYEAIAGVMAEVNPLLRWRLMGGYGVRDYDSDLFKRAGNILLEAELQWLPTQLLTLYATGRRAYADGNGLASASARLDHSVDLKLEYEVLRNLVFTLGGEYRHSATLTDDQQDRTLIGRVGIDYWHTKNWLVSMSYEHLQKHLNEEDGTTTRNRVWLTTKLRF